MCDVFVLHDYNNHKDHFQTPFDVVGSTVSVKCPLAGEKIPEDRVIIQTTPCHHRPAGSGHHHLSRGETKSLLPMTIGK